MLSTLMPKVPLLPTRERFLGVSSRPWVGMHPLGRRPPPPCSRSMRAAEGPSCVAWIAAVSPPLPPPMATTSKSATACSSQRQPPALEVSLPLIAEIQVAYHILSQGTGRLSNGIRPLRGSPVGRRWGRLIPRQFSRFERCLRESQSSV